MGKKKENLFLVLSLSHSEIEKTTSISKATNPPTWLNNNQEESFRFPIFKRYRTSLIIKLKRRDVLGMSHTVWPASFNSISINCPLTCLNLSNLKASFVYTEFFSLMVFCNLDNISKSSLD